MIEVECEVPSAWDQYLCDWGRESLKATAPALTDALHKLVVLDGVLLGAALLWAEKGLMPTAARAAFMLVLIFSLMFAVFGACPQGREVNVNNPADVRAFEFGAIRRKRLAFRWAGATLILGFVVALVGIVVQATT